MIKKIWNIIKPKLYFYIDIGMIDLKFALMADSFSEMEFIYFGYDLRIYRWNSKFVIARYHRQCKPRMTFNFDLGIIKIWTERFTYKHSENEWRERTVILHKWRKS
jgi:hypothetical protein